MVEEKVLHGVAQGVLSAVGVLDQLVEVFFASFGVELGGVATMLGSTEKSDLTYFI